MDELRNIVLSLPDDLQRFILNRVAGSYSAWVVDSFLFIDCVNFWDEGELEDDINFIQLCAHLGWVGHAILIPIREERTFFWGDWVNYHRRSHLGDVAVIIHALDTLPYSFDEEYRLIVEREDNPAAPPPSPAVSHNLPPPPQHWPYTTQFYPHWNPRSGYNPLDNPAINRAIPTWWADPRWDAQWDDDREEDEARETWATC